MRSLNNRNTTTRSVNSTLTGGLSPSSNLSLNSVVGANRTNRHSITSNVQSGSQQTTPSVNSTTASNLLEQSGNAETAALHAAYSAQQ